MTGKRGRQLLPAFLSMMLMGANAVVTGALLPVIIEDLNLSTSQAGLLVASPAVGYVVAATLAGILGDLWGHKRGWLLGALAGAISLSGVTLAPSFPWLLPTMAAMGLVAGFFDGSINPLVAAVGGERSGSMLNRVHLFFGMGATVTPLFLGIALRHGVGWRAPYAVLGAYVVLIGLILLRTRFPPQVAVESKGRFSGKLLASRVVLLSALTIMIYGGVEASILSWLALYLEQVRTLTIDAASFSVSFFSATILVGRFLCSRVVEGIGYRRLIVGGSWLGGIGLALMLILPGKALPWLGLILTGLALSGLWATIMADVTRRVPQQMGAVAGILCSASGLGKIILPWLVGQVAETATLSLGLGLVALCSVATGAIYRRI
ncbi:MAG: MFS transporter [Anaerolineales bacterium]